MVDSVIQIRELKRHYKMGDNIVKALDGVSFDINRNEYVAIM